MKTIAFFNNKGRVGKTTLVYHVAWMLSGMGVRVLAVDLDPQSNLTAMFLSPDRMDELQADTGGGMTILGATESVLKAPDALPRPHVEDVDGIGLVPGDIGLYAFEDRLVAAWSSCLAEDPTTAANAFGVITAFYRVILRAANEHGAEVVLLDLGPSLDAINRAALVAADFVVLPLSADRFSILALRTLGPRLREWRDGWEKRRKEGKIPAALPVPMGKMQPIGYTVLLHALYRGRPLTSDQRWLDEIPGAYRELVLGEAAVPVPSGDDPHRLATLRARRSLMELAQESHKPMFALRPADGAIGGHAQAVVDAYQDFESLARRIAERSGITIS